MKFTLSIITLAFMFASCNQDLENTRTEKENEPIQKDTTKLIQNYKLLDGCYTMIISNDTAVMTVSQKGDSLTGSLIYNRKDKDDNTGTVYLLKTNDRAEGWYAYQSEGKTSVRQVVFKINENTLAEGYGDIKMNNDTAIFKYPHALNFEEKHRFNKVNCK
jgi:hypothetical protein